METIVDQEAAKVILKAKVTISKTTYDNRGWYICGNGGIYHLYTDGIIRGGASGVGSSSTAFWRTRKEARDFYKAWKKI